MALYRSDLPQFYGDPFITDGGIETTLIFNEGMELPLFASFVLLGSDRGRAALRKYYATYADVALQHRVGLILESPTWRASADWGEKLGYSKHDVDNANRAAIELMEEIRANYATETTRMVISGCIGPRGDGYRPAWLMSPDEAEEYHLRQIALFSETDADLITAITMTYPAEAIGIVRAAQSVTMPVAISFTVETDGRLPNGQTLQEAIEETDSATDGGAAGFMINCAHPTHFADVLASGGAWLHRIRGIRANASTKSHAELDEATELDSGDPSDLAQRYVSLHSMLPHLSVFGGCCGTDHRHVDAIARSCLGI